MFISVSFPKFKICISYCVELIEMIFVNKNFGNMRPGIAAELAVKLVACLDFMNATDCRDIKSYTDNDKDIL